jgi:hypothetical protein
MNPRGLVGKAGKGGADELSGVDDFDVFPRGNIWGRGSRKFWSHCPSLLCWRLRARSFGGVRIAIV